MNASEFLNHLFFKDAEFYSSLKKIMGFYPGNITLYRLAFRHRSLVDYSKGEKMTNDRLEFLGDAVVGAVISHHLFSLFPYKDEGFLTMLKAKIVSREHLNKLGVHIGLDKFVDIREKSSKSLYGDIFEAFVGAVYLDKGYKKANWFIIEKALKNNVDIGAMESKEVNFKGKLFDWVQKERKELMFQVIGQKKSRNNIIYEICAMIDGNKYGVGKGFAKKEAEQRAAEATCAMLNF